MYQEHVIVSNGSDNNQMRTQGVSDVTLTFHAGAAVGWWMVDAQYHVSASSVNDDSSPFNGASPALTKKKKTIIQCFTNLHPEYVMFLIYPNIRRLYRHVYIQNDPWNNN